MRKEYRVIALDMDGTVLNDQKQMGERTKQAIHRALAAGKEVVFCTGRSYAEMMEILEEFPDMHYLCGESGALLYDIEKKRPLKMSSIKAEDIQTIREVTAGRDIMPHFISEGRSVVNRDTLHRMEHYQMGAFQPAYLRTATAVADVFQMAEEKKCSVEKINLFHTSPQERAESRKMLEEKRPFLTMVDSEISSLECTLFGVDKAVGLRALCETLRITMEQVIMVGDADNDCAALEAAGLAVAVGNANEKVKAICDVQVADNNHDGCAEAIERYLLGEQNEDNSKDRE